MVEATMDVAAFDQISVEAARELLRAVCASENYLDAIAAYRPYADLADLIARSDALIAGLAWPDVEQALAAHPRIGERAVGPALDTSWSREEQAGAATADDEAAAALRRGNVDYEQRFGFVFLISASGRSPQQLLAALRERLDNPLAFEQDVVRAELAAIARLRLARVLA